MAPWRWSCPCCVTAALLALTFSRTQALIYQQANDTPMLEHPGTLGSGPYRQRITNFNDVMYFADMIVGGQKINGLLDTSSSDVLIFPTKCPTCGISQAYNISLSKTLVEGKHRTMNSYGSGSCTTVNATETIRMGSLEAKQQAFLEARSCQMPLLEHVAFNAVIGIGPPNEPVHSAEQTLRRLRDQIKKAEKSKKNDLSSQFSSMERKLKDNLQYVRETRSLLENFNVATFSVCLERKKGAPGWFIWNDDSIINTSDANKIEVVGQDRWGVKLKNMQLDGKEKHNSIMVGCSKGCSAILDTGTSLLGVPSNVYKKIHSTLKGKKSVNCNDLSNLPDIVLELDSHQIRLPPDSYIGTLVGKESGPVSLPRLEFGKGEPGQTCELLLMDTGERRTKFGPVVILGVPFFREYYTTFQIGKSGSAGEDAGIDSKEGRSAGGNDLSIFIAPATDDCQPASKQQLSLVGEDRAVAALGKVRPMSAKQVNASQLRLPIYETDSSPLPAIKQAH